MVGRLSRTCPPLILGKRASRDPVPEDCSKGPQQPDLERWTQGPQQGALPHLAPMGSRVSTVFPDPSCVYSLPSSFACVPLQHGYHEIYMILHPVCPKRRGLCLSCNDGLEARTPMQRGPGPLDMLWDSDKHVCRNSLC